MLSRRATDLWEADHTGIMNTVVPEAHLPSHQGPDAQTVLPDLDVITAAAKAAQACPVGTSRGRGVLCPTYNERAQLALARPVTASAACWVSELSAGQDA